MENSKRTAILGNIGHGLTAFTVFLKGLDKIDQPGKFGIGMLFMCIAAFFVLGIVFHHKAEKLFKHFQLYAFLLESIVMATVGYLYMKDGKVYLPYFCFFASAMFIVAAVIYLIKQRKSSTATAH